MKSKMIIVVLLLAMVLCFAMGCNLPIENEVSDGTLDKVTKFQQIDNSTDFSKYFDQNEWAEYILNDDDVITAIVMTGEKSLADYYLQSDYATFTQYVLSTEAGTLIAEMTERQETVKNSVSAVMDVEFESNYTALLDGFSVNMRYGDFKALKNVEGVRFAVISEEYTAPSATFSVEQIAASMQSTGIFANNTQYKGEGMVVAVVDSGLDYTHPAFATDPGVYGLTYSDIEALAGSVYGAARRFTADKYYKSGKIPFQYDYAGNDADAKPTSNGTNSYAGYHGTHVAGIVAADNEEVTGIAPKAQILGMKVFPDNSAGASFSHIVAALGDCAVLGVDIINLSLGSACGITVENSEAKQFINEIYSKLDKLGICVVAAVGNSYGQGEANVSGYAATENPDVGTISSPATYDAAYAVASVDSVMLQYVTYNGTFVRFNSAVDMNGIAYPVIETILGENSEATLELVAVPGVGNTSDYEGLDIKGKTVLVQRGEISFEDKMRNAADAGATACIIYNNVAGEIINAQVSEMVIPTGTIMLEDAEIILAGMKDGINTITVTAYAKNYSMSDFSSWGVQPDLTLKPDITAPGGDIYSTMPTNFNGGLYAYASGTSMASPNTAGLTAVVLQYLRAEYPYLTTRQARELAYQLMMSTAVKAVDNYGVYVSPRKQGAGVANLENLIATKAYLTVTGSERTKIELGQDIEKAGIYTLRFNLVNTSATALSYEADALIMTETAQNGLIMGRGHVFADRALEIRVKNGTLENGIVTVEAGESAGITMVITLTEEEKSYMDDNFVNGIFVEGFAELNSVDGGVDLSIPFMGYYGDWTAPGLVDKTLYDEEDAYIYPCYVVGMPFIMGQYMFSHAMPEGAEIPEFGPETMAITMDELGNCFIQGISLTLLRNIRHLAYRITDEYTGYEYYYAWAEDVQKTHINGQYIMVTQHGLYIENFGGNTFDWENNKTFILSVEAQLAYDGAETVELFSFPITFDCEKPTLNSIEIRHENGRVYADFDVYDNHYFQAFCFGYNAGVDMYGNNLNLYEPFYRPVYNYVYGENNKITADITDIYNEANGRELRIDLIDTALNASSYAILETEVEENSSNPTGFVSGGSYGYTATMGADVEYFDSVTEEGTAVITSDASEEHKFEIENGVLLKYTGPGGDVVVPDGVTEIAREAFDKQKTITSVVFPEGLTKIGIYAFRSCQAITKVVFPSTLTRIEGGAFTLCYSLVDMNLEETNVNYIGNFAFNYCIGLKEIVIPKAEAPITIGIDAFAVCSACESIVVKNDVSSLGQGAFNFNEKLSELVFEGDVNCKLTGGWNFMGLDSLEVVVFGGNVGTLGADNTSSPIFSANHTIREVYFKGDVAGIAGLVFSNCSNLEKVEFGGSIGTYKKRYAFGGCPKLKHFSVAEGNDKLIFDEETGIVYNAEKTAMYIPSSWRYQGDVVLPETLTTFDVYQFSHAVNMMNSYEWGWAVFDTGAMVSYSFSTKVITEELDTIRSITFTGNVTAIPNYFARNVASLKAVYGTENVTSIGNYAFNKCYALENVEFPNAKTYGNYAFQYCSSLREWTVPATVTGLGNSTFADCTGLKKVEMLCSATALTSNLFARCTSLESVNIPATIKTVSGSVFDGCSSLRSVEFPTGIKTLGSNIFRNCTSLERVVLPDTLTAIPGYAFQNCTALKTVELPIGVKTIAAYAFSGSGIEEITLPAAVTSFVALTSFENCFDMKALNVEEGNTKYVSIDGVVYNNTKTTIVFYPIAKADVDEYVLPETVTTIGDGAFAYNAYVETLVAENVTTIAQKAFFNAAIRFVEGDNIISIATRAFEGSDIESINTEKVKTFEDYAFMGAAKFENADVSSAEIIRKSAFMNSGIKNVVLSAGITEIWTRAFSGCDIEKLYIAADICEFDYSYVFLNAKIAAVEVEEGNDRFVVDGDMLMNTSKTLIYTYTGENADVVIPEGVEKIGVSAFVNNENLVKVTFPKSLKIIGANAFYGCQSLEEVVFTSERAPKLEGITDTTHMGYYANFVCYLDEVEEKGVALKLYHPASASYMTYVWEGFFAERYEATENGYNKLEASVTEVNAMLKEIAQGNLSVMERANSEYAKLSATQKSCINNARLLNAGVSSQSNPSYGYVAAFAAIIAFTFIALKRLIK